MEQARGRRHYNNNGGRGYYGNNGNNYQQNSRGREFHASASNSRTGGLNNGQDHNNNSFGNCGPRPTVSNWRNLIKRQNELVGDKLQSLRDIVDCRDETLKAKDIPAADKKDSSSVERTKNSSEANSNSSSKSKKSSYEEDKSVLNNKFAQREKRLDQDMQKFFHDVVLHIQALERRAFEPRYYESEINVRDQQILFCHQKLASLEEKNRNANAELDYYRTLTHQMRMNKIQMEHDLMAEKDAAVVKAKAETMAQIIKSGLKTNFSSWQDPFVASDPKLELDPSSGIPPHPLLSSATFHAWVSDSQSPCLQPMPAFEASGFLSDLRDRYEDVKCAGFIENNERTDWILNMIRKVVTFYENQNMRVYEESLENQYISTLIWCSNDVLCPQKSDSSFALGHGPTQLEATENALVQAYNWIIVDSEKESSNSSLENSNVDSSGSESESSSSSFKEELPHDKEDSCSNLPEDPGIGTLENQGFEDIPQEESGELVTLPSTPDSPEVDSPNESGETPAANFETCKSELNLTAESEFPFLMSPQTQSHKSTSN